MAAEEDARDVAEAEQRIRQRGGFRFLGRREVARAGTHDLTAGQEFDGRRIGRQFGLDQHGPHVAMVGAKIKRFGTSLPAGD